MYWEDGELIFENYALRTRMSADPLVCSILNYCHEWRSARSICSHLNVNATTSVRAALKKLHANGVLDRFGDAPDPRAEAMNEWSAWNPAAGFFHFSTKDTEFAQNQAKAFADWTKQNGSKKMPLPVKRYPNAARTQLPKVKTHGEFPDVLLNRRTWRKYGRGAVSRESLSQILKLTFGIHGWVDVPGGGRAAMKTAPSGGDLHPIEAYAVVQRVEGVRPGVYHYNAARHALERIRKEIPRRDLERNLGGQWWFAGAAFLVVMTAVSGRTRWKYEFPRAYRALLLEAGHLGQSFCLVATWKGLAPFSTIAMKDTKWEEWLGIDGVKESVVYVLGAGNRPEAEEMRNAHLGMLCKR
jgi:SagB-type dehydrogenase family enzyme